MSWGPSAAGRSNMNNENKKEVDLLEYWKIILKRKWVMVSFTGALLFFTGIYSFLAKPLYKATTTLLIEDEISKMLNIYETFGYQPQFGQDLRFFNTQLTLLKSLSLSEPPLRRITIEKKKNQPAPLSSSKQKEKTAATMEGVFPDALTPLVEADPEVFGILEDEKKRQW